MSGTTRTSRTRFVAVAALAWALVCAASASWSLSARGWLEPIDMALVVAALFFGGFAGFAVAYWFQMKLAISPGARLAGFLLLALAASVAMAGFALALPQHLYHGQWRAPVFSQIWFIQTAFSFVSAYYQFAVLALRLYFPVPFLVLLTIGWVLLRPRH